MHRESSRHGELFTLKNERHLTSCWNNVWIELGYIQLLWIRSCQRTTLDRPKTLGWLGAGVCPNALPASIGVLVHVTTPGKTRARKVTYTGIPIPQDPSFSILTIFRFYLFSLGGIWKVCSLGAGNFWELGNPASKINSCDVLTLRHLILSPPPPPNDNADLCLELYVGKN